jgi:hypothetical protein
MISVTFDWRKCKLAFPSAGWGMGLQKPISKWIPNSLPLRLFYLLIMMKHVSFSPNLYFIACQFYVMFLLTLKREGYRVWTNWPICRQVDLHANIQRRHAKNVTNLKLLTHVDCKTVTSCMSEDSPESNYSKLISRRRKRPVTATSAKSIDPLTPKTKFITFVFAHLLERMKLLLSIWIHMAI